MGRTLSISEARNNLTSLPARFVREPEAIEITQRGKPVMALLPWDLYESLVETIDVMADAGLMRALRKDLKELSRGKTYSSAEVRKKLNL